MDREPLNSVFPSRSNSVDETNHDEQIHVEGHPLSPRHPHSVGGHEPDSDSDTQSPHSLSDHDSESDSDTHSNDGRGPPPSYLHSQANNFADGSELEELYLLVEHQYQQYVLSVSRLQTLMQRIRVTLTLMVFVLTVCPQLMISILTLTPFSLQIGIFTVCAIALLIIQRLITIRNIKIAPDLDTSSRIIQLGAAPGERVLVPIVSTYCRLKDEGLVQTFSSQGYRNSRIDVI